MKFPIADLIKPKKGSGSGVRANLKRRTMSKTAIALLELLRNNNPIECIPKPEIMKTLGITSRTFDSAIAALRSNEYNVECVPLKMNVYGYRLVRGEHE